TQTLRSGDQIYDSHFYAADFLRDFNNELRQWRHASAQVDWNYKTNLTDSNRNQKLKIDSDFENWWRRKLKEAKKFRQEALPETFSRQLAMITLTATSEKNDLNRRRDFILSRMEAIYGSTKACLTRNSCLPLEPSLVDIMTKSRDPEFLKETWLQWRNSIGPKVRPYFTQLIQILNEAAVENGFSDYSDFWKQDLFFNTSTLDATIITLWTEVKPFYQQLHAYVRRKLRERYGSGIIGIDGAIPAHLLGNMWAQHWPNILDIVSPYPELNQQPSIEARLRKSFNVHGMFRLANTFYTSLGLYPMSSTFWDKSMFTKPRDKNFVCHASAFDLYFPGDF
ncbi:angiotensin-converting enzyme, partial [Biomphalaria glabrata]